MGLRSVFLIAAIAAGLVFIYARLGPQIRKPVSALPVGTTESAIPRFQLLDQNGQTFGSDKLAGKVWVADFVFTGCAASCPKLTGRLLELQKQFAEPPLELVSFDVDPDHDTPAILRQYGQSRGADFSRWHFLSAPKFETIFQVAHSLGMTRQKDEHEFVLLHSDLILLFDRGGKLVGRFDGNSEPQMDALNRAIAAAIRE